MEENKELSVTDVISLTETKNLKELELKIKEIEEKIKIKAESILVKEDIDYMDYQILNSYTYDLKRKIEDIKRKDSNEELIQLMAKTLSKTF